MATPNNYAVATLKDHIGFDFGRSTPALLDQPRIDLFAQCTGDDQWIHLDTERARAELPFGTTIAHGLLVLALIPAAHYELGVYPSDASSVLNYGMDRVRFLAPVPAGSSISVRVELVEVEPKNGGRLLVRCRNTAFRLDDPERPVMAADTLAMVQS